MASGERSVVCVPLGAHCAPGIGLRTCGFRTAALPFDWLRTPSAAALVRCLTDDFASFLEAPRRVSAHAAGSAIQDAYGFQFPHDFPTAFAPRPGEGADGQEWAEATILDGWEGALDAVRAKYRRRVDRLRGVLAGGGPVLLVRLDGTSHAEAEALLAALERAYPAARVALLAVNCGDVREVPGRIATASIGGGGIWQGEPWRAAVSAAAARLFPAA